MADEEINRRMRQQRLVAGALSGTDDAAVASLLDASASDGGIGGVTANVEVEGVPVFAKIVPLTAREVALAGVTGNLFGLPAGCHYGVGGPGLNAWRELASVNATSQWVVDGRSAQFPLLYHWRLLPGATALADELVDVDRVVAYWGGDAAVRKRVQALAAASARLVMFLEHIPHALDTWLGEQVLLGQPAADAAAALLEAELLAGVDAMATGGLIHFDAHFGNILTDGRRLYFADFGLAVSENFDLDSEEIAFASHHRNHDRAYVIARLVNWLVTTFADSPGVSSPVVRNDYIRQCAATGRAPGMPAPHAATVLRYAPVAALFNDFFAAVLTVDPFTPYPADAVDAALDLL